MNWKEKVGRILTITGAVVFIYVLFLSAYWEKDIRWLHFFQSWMYIALIVLVLRGNRWGYFIGLGAALLWDYTNLFVTTFLRAGLAQLHVFAQTGHLSRPDQFVSVPGWLGNFAIIVGVLVAYAGFPRKQATDLVRFTVAFVGTTAFFALDMYLSQPRYLPLFPAMLHPHLHL